MKPVKESTSKKIMVFDVPAESGGALSILEDYYNQAVKSKKPNIRWCFVLGKAKLKETENITVIRFPWLKKSWLHRLYFDHIVAPRLVRNYNPQKILSLQNILVPHVEKPQVLYLHQSLPFVNFKFKILKNPKLWSYQNIISKLIFRSIKRANKVIVQTQWMKKACIEETKINGSKVIVTPPKISIEPKALFKPTKEALSTFFYPAAPLTYKNHDIILDACALLLKKVNFKVVFTIKGNENDHARRLFKRSREECLPVEFLGSISREKVFDLYTKSVLLFPSYIESFPLPLKELKIHKGIALVSNYPFCHEILDGYESAFFFDPFNSKEVAEHMVQICNYSVPPSI
nr:glycosyltransferase [uncultured Dethiosulfovibrio sp.]